MALKKVTSINTNNIKQIVLKDIIVDCEDYPIELEDMLEKAYNQDIYYMNSKSESKNIYFAVEDVPNCCGLKEIGDLFDITFVSQKAFNVMIKGLLMSGLTFIINTNGEKKSLTWDEKILKSNMFTCVKEFVNPSSRNLIKIWISNHIK